MENLAERAKSEAKRKEECVLEVSGVNLEKKW